MTERFEWTEPEEATEERRARRRKSLAFIGRLYLLNVGVIVPVQMAASLSPFSLAKLCFLTAGHSIVFSFLAWYQVQSSQRSFVLDSSAACVKEKMDSRRVAWKRIHSHEITDHPELPEFRRLVLRSDKDLELASLDFRMGQIDESALRQFVESRIAEQRARRLMRRVRA